MRYQSTGRECLGRRVPLGGFCGLGRGLLRSGGLVLGLGIRLL